MSQFILTIDLGDEDCGITGTQELADILIKAANRIAKTGYNLDKPIVRGIVNLQSEVVGEWKIETEEDDDK